MAKVLSNSKTELRAARNALEAMQRSEKPADFLEAWGTFVDRLEKVWTKSERECQVFKGRFEPWQGSFKRLRKEDELLCYLFHARNADQHTIEMIAGHAPVGFELRLEGGHTAEFIIDRKTNRITIRGGTVLQRHGPKYILLPFKDRGKTYNPPTMHRGIKLKQFDPVQAAELGLAFYEGYVQELEQTFFAPLRSVDE